MRACILCLLARLLHPGRGIISLSPPHAMQRQKHASATEPSPAGHREIISGELATGLTSAKGDAPSRSGEERPHQENNHEVRSGVGERVSLGLGRGNGAQQDEQGHDQQGAGYHPGTDATGGAAPAGGSALQMPSAMATPGRVRRGRRHQKRDAHRNYQVFVCSHCQHIDKCPGSDRGGLMRQVSMTPTSASSVLSSRHATPFSSRPTRETPATDPRRPPRSSPAVPGTARVLTSPDFLRVAASTTLATPPSKSLTSPAAMPLSTPRLNERGGTATPEGFSAQGEVKGMAATSPQALSGDHRPSALGHGDGDMVAKPALEVASAAPPGATATGRPIPETNAHMATTSPGVPTFQQSSSSLEKLVNTPTMPSVAKSELPRPQGWMSPSLSSLSRPSSLLSSLLSPTPVKSSTPSGSQASPGSGQGHLGKAADPRGGKVIKSASVGATVEPGGPSSASKSKRKRSGKWQSLKDIVTAEADD
eukprot:jgi/Mesvir1/20862/Mv07948-RA.2